MLLLNVIGEACLLMAVIAGVVRGLKLERVGMITDQATMCVKMSEKMCCMWTRG